MNQLKEEQVSKLSKLLKRIHNAVFHDYQEGIFGGYKRDNIFRTLSRYHTAFYILKAYDDNDVKKTLHQDIICCFLEKEIYNKYDNTVEDVTNLIYFIGNNITNITYKYKQKLSLTFTDKFIDKGYTMNKEHDYECKKILAQLICKLDLIDMELVTGIKTVKDLCRINGKSYEANKKYVNRLRESNKAEYDEFVKDIR